jgi:hypothetical protein
LTDQTVGLPSYHVLEGSGVSTLNSLLQLQACDTVGAELTLRDPETESDITILLVSVRLEHDSVEGVIFFDGTLENGGTITGHVRPTADPGTFIVGKANVKL